MSESLGASGFIACTNGVCYQAKGSGDGKKMGRKKVGNTGYSDLVSKYDFQVISSNVLIRICDLSPGGYKL